MTVSILGLAAIQANLARAADPTAPAKAPLISGMPLLLTTETTAEFVFGPGTGETQSVTGYVCRIDNEDFQPCSSPLTLSNVTIGGHFIGIKASNAIGKGPEATFAWTVDPVPPDLPFLEPIVVSPTVQPLKVGKQTKIAVKVTNSGDAAATGVKICVATHSQQISVKKCQTIKSVAAGATATSKFTVSLSKNAKKGKDAVLTFTATSGDLEPQKAKATVNFR